MTSAFLSNCFILAIRSEKLMAFPGIGNGVPGGRLHRRGGRLAGTGLRLGSSGLAAKRPGSPKDPGCVPGGAFGGLLAAAGLSAIFGILALDRGRFRSRSAASAGVRCRCWRRGDRRGLLQARLNVRRDRIRRRRLFLRQLRDASIPSRAESGCARCPSLCRPTRSRAMRGWLHRAAVFSFSTRAWSLAFVS